MILKVAVLGAGGGVGRLVVKKALESGYSVTAQTRSAEKLKDQAGLVSISAFDPADPAAMADFVRDQDAVVFALGYDKGGATTFFSSVTANLVAAMNAAGVTRLIAITGVGAGETKGHGGFRYDRIIYPLFTKKTYEDKDRQEELIESSLIDWTLVRPAPFAKQSPDGPLEVHTSIASDTILRRITRDEVAQFTVDELQARRYVRQKPFIGHP